MDSDSVVAKFDLRYHSSNSRGEDGHIIGCGFSQRPNRFNRCRGATKNHRKCLTPISRQSCCLNFEGGSLCKGGRESSDKSHWHSYCEDKGWDTNLSVCANIKADELRLTEADRRMINQNNIEQLLGIPTEVKYNHISDRRRRECSQVSKQIASQSIDSSTDDESITSEEIEAINSLNELKKAKSDQRNQEIENLEWTEKKFAEQRERANQAIEQIAKRAKFNSSINYPFPSIDRIVSVPF